MPPTQAQLLAFRLCCPPGGSTLELALLRHDGFRRGVLGWVRSHALGGHHHHRCLGGLDADQLVCHSVED